MQWFEILKVSPGQERKNYVSCGPPGWWQTPGSRLHGAVWVHRCVFTRQYLLCVCDVPGTILGAGDPAGNNAKPLRSWDLHFSARDRKKINK